MIKIESNRKEYESLHPYLQSFLEDKKTTTAYLKQSTLGICIRTGISW